MHEGHRERLRRRFLREGGLEGFEEHVVLELLLFYARPRCDTNALAHDLIRRFGSFAAVLDASVEELATVPGIGENSAVLLKMVPALGAYYLSNRGVAGTILNSTEKAGQFFLPLFIGKTTETVYVASLDDRRKLIRCTRLPGAGVVNAAAISVKSVVSEAVKANATGVILAHNHPAGLALPSAGDKAVTRQIHKALRLINVALVDHIIVSDEDYVSLADSGFLATMDWE